MRTGTTRRGLRCPELAGKPGIYVALVLLISITALWPEDVRAMKAGASRRDVTVPELLGNPAVHDPLFARVLVLDDGDNAVAIICLDMVNPWFPDVREKIQKQLGISQVLVNCSHTHQDARGGHNDRWREAVGQLIYDAAEEAHANRVPVSLHAGRAPVVVGINRYGDAFTQDVVPWVNVLEARAEDGRQVAVLFEHPAHPVMTLDAPDGLTADFPGYAVARIQEELGDEVVAMFAQGCGGNTNAEPVGFSVKSGWYENAERQGRKLGNAVLAAMRKGTEIKADKFTLRSKTIMLPLRVPTIAQWAEQVTRLKEERPDDEAAMKSLQLVKGIIERGEQPGLPMEVNAVMLGSEWCLVAMRGEAFTEYELWVNAFAPFDHNMVFAYTNDVANPFEEHYTSYILTDRALALSINHPDQANRSCRDALRVHSPTTHKGVRLPYAVGIEVAIKEAIASLWAR